MRLMVVVEGGESKRDGSAKASREQSDEQIDTSQFLDS